MDLQTLNVKRALQQQLASLEAAGVQQLPRVEFTPAPVSATAACGLAEPAQVVASKSVASSENAAKLAATSVAKPLAASRQAARAVVVADAGSSVSTADSLPVLAAEVAGCTLCDELAATRTQTVFGVGNPKARLCILGEAPGADEDAQGEPFVGQSGQLLTKILAACGLARDDVYILNILKCRPPGNRNPAPQESDNCRQFLIRQLQLIQPEFICCLGAVAAQNLLETTTSIGRLRGKLHDYRGIQVICTYHPAYLLRNPAAKKDCWEDMKLLMSEMGTPVE